jgi:hypothetical protein
VVNDTFNRDLETLRRVVLNDRLDDLLAMGETDRRAQLRSMLEHGASGIASVSTQDLLQQACDAGLDRRSPELVGRLVASLAENPAAKKATEDTPQEPSLSAMQAMWKFASVLVEKHGEDGDRTMTDAEHEQWREAAGLCHDAIRYRDAAGASGLLSRQSEHQPDSEAHMAEEEALDSKKLRVLVVVSGGVADYVADTGVEVNVFDWDNYNADPNETGGVPEEFADLANPIDVPVEEGMTSRIRQRP